MNHSFFEFDHYRSFLTARYQFLKDTKPAFSARYFARKAGIKSPSYFRMVTNGERSLSRNMALSFAEGLSLSSVEKKCLLNAIELENCRDHERKKELRQERERLRYKTEASPIKMQNKHLEILSDPLNVKLYLLVQSSKFKLSLQWISSQFSNQLPLEDIERRVSILFDSGLWKNNNGKIEAVSPDLVTGDGTAGDMLKKYQESLLDSAKDVLYKKTSAERVCCSRAILFDPKDFDAIVDRINEFKREIDIDFSCKDSSKVYSMQINFMEISP